MIQLASNDAQLVRLRLCAASAETDVIVGHNTLSYIGELLEAYRSAHLVLITDQHIAPLYALPLRDLLEEGGYQIHLLEIIAGEESKTFGTLTHLYEVCQDLHIERT